MPPPPSSSSGDALPATHGGANNTATIWTLAQVTAAFLLAGFGNVGAGVILDYVKEWPVFLHVNELFVLVPSLLGLKGNLEMTMASRLSTQANLGHMDNAHELFKMAKGNLALVQCQATVVSFVVAIFASVVKSITSGSAIVTSTSTDAMIDPMDASVTSGSLSGVLAPQAHVLGNSMMMMNNSNSNVIMMMSSSNNNNVLQQQQQQAFADNSPQTVDVVHATTGGFDWDNALILCASSLLTANIACFVLGTLMILVIVGSHRMHIDPDNVASPVAASLGDMTTAALLAVIAHSIYHYSLEQQFPYLALIITVLFLGMLPVWISVARSNPYTADVVTKGWTPIVIAVFISSCGGFILEHGKSRFSRLPVFQPVINGVGGNLVAVQASRLSTSLHRLGKPGELPLNFKMFSGPFDIFVSRKNDINATTARLLLSLSLPAHLLYFFVIRAIEGSGDGEAPPVTSIFLGLYMLLAILQVSCAVSSKRSACQLIRHTCLFAYIHVITGLVCTYCASLPKARVFNRDECQ